MRNWLCALFISAYLLWPSVCGAADLKINLSFAGDAAACGEVVYDGQLVWRVMVLSDGVRPAALQQSVRTTFLVPSLANGFYWLEIQNQ